MPERVSLAVVIARIRWTGVALLLGQALITNATPAWRTAILAVGLAMAVYNLPATMCRRLPAKLVEPVIGLTLIGDFLAGSAWLLLNASGVLDGSFLAYIPVALEAGVTYRWRGALAFLIAMTMGLFVQHPERGWFGPGVPPSSDGVPLATALLAATFSAGMASQNSRLHAGARLAARSLAREREAARHERVERQQAEAAMRAGEEGLRTLVSNAPVMLFTLNRKGVITLCEGLGLAALGRKAGDAVGWSVQELFGQDPHVLQSIGQALAGKTVQTTASEGERSFALTFGPLRIGRGEVAGAIGVALDVTDRKRAGEDLRLSVEKLRRVDRERRALLGRMVLVQEEERQRIANDIHDDSIQSIVAVGLRLRALRAQVRDPNHLQALSNLEAAVESAIDRLRHLLFELRPLALRQEGLLAALRQYLEEMTAEAKIHCQVESHLATEPREETRVTVYRIAQEALVNVRKHARASRVEVWLGEQDGGILVRIQDNGKGIDAKESERPAPGHLGLAGMRERAEMVGGWLRLESSPGAGTKLEFWIPLPAALESDAA